LHSFFRMIYLDFTFRFNYYKLKSMAKAPQRDSLRRLFITVHKTFQRRPVRGQYTKAHSAYTAQAMTEITKPIFGKSPADTSPVS